MMSIMAAFDLDATQMDVTNAFLNAEIEDENVLVTCTRIPYTQQMLPLTRSPIWTN